MNVIGVNCHDLKNLIKPAVVIEISCIFRIRTLIFINKMLVNVGDDYRQTSNINCTLVSNKIVDHPDVVGASPVSAAPATFSFSTWHLTSYGLSKDNHKTRRETFKYWYLVRLVLEVWR